MHGSWGRKMSRKRMEEEVEEVVVERRGSERRVKMRNGV